MGITCSKPSEENLADIRPIVPVGVLEKKHIGSMSKEDSPAGKSHRGGNIETIRKNGKLISPSVTVGILTNFDSITTLPPLFDFVWVIDRFDHPKSSPLIPLKINGVHNVRFRNKQLEPEANGHLRILYTLFRRKR